MNGASGIRLLTCDVDGVLTDGRIYVDDTGRETKAFSALDGVGLKLLMQAGVRSHGSPGAALPAVMHRARALGIDRVIQGAEDKLTPWEALRGELDLPAAACAHIGDDLPDVPVFARCGFSVTVPHAPPSVRAQRAFRDGARRRQGRGARVVRADPRRPGHASTAASGLMNSPHAHWRFAAPARGAHSALRAAGRADERPPRSLRSLPPAGAHSALRAAGRALMTPRRPRVDRLVAWSPVLLLGCLAALTYWLDAQVQTSGRRDDGSSRHDPDLYIERFSAVSFDVDGRVRQMLAATRAEHFPDDGSVELIAPSLELTDPGKPRLTVTADGGTVTGDREIGHFARPGPGHARCRARHRARQEPGRGGDVRHRNPARHSKGGAGRDRPLVTIEEPRGIIQGVGMALDNNARTVRLKSAVRGTLQPNLLPK